jgi:multicomponent Na+:H+ antiporter subunit D
VFWKPKARQTKQVLRETVSSYTLYLPVAFLLAFILAMSLHAEPFIALAKQSSDQIFHSEYYINAVLKNAN